MGDSIVVDTFKGLFHRTELCFMDIVQVGTCPQHQHVGRSSSGYVHWHGVWSCSLDPAKAASFCHFNRVDRNAHVLSNYVELVEPRTRGKRYAASVLPRHLSGTIYHDTSETMSLVVNNSLAIWRQFCLHRTIRQRRLWERLINVL